MRVRAKSGGGRAERRAGGGWKDGMAVPAGAVPVTENAICFVGERVTELRDGTLVPTSELARRCSRQWTGLQEENDRCISGAAL